MNFSQTLARTSLLSSHFSIPSLPFRHGFQQNCRRIRCIPELSIPNSVAISEPLILEPSENLAEDTVEQLLAPQSNEIVSKMMKMERKSSCNANLQDNNGRWFPYLDKFKVNDIYLSSAEVLEAIDPLILEVRKERFRNVVKNRSFSVCLVVEGLSDFGNVSAACRSADALGFQSVHVVSCDSSKRFRDNRHVSMGSEKWLDLEVWNSTRDCFNVLKSRGYRIATTHLGKDTVSIYDMDWSCPTAIVVGNENRTSRMGSHGDLTSDESQILLAEFFLRHSKSAISMAHEYAKRKSSNALSKL
ncbi:uncharacterized protein LOC110735061 isoform X2 [Chenopodium quinoa]|uniref:uncharacterized protein LOC110735061 isoform X2 n=1 Tax=Chenopodium quinoa TaxID=63459 RepID=UPI000B783814|nr:uncharacterized protein LOC110735061 isoform X2 [Chenopodium quinoa]